MRRYAVVVVVVAVAGRGKLKNVRKVNEFQIQNTGCVDKYVQDAVADLAVMGAGTGGAGWASAHPGKNQGGHGPPWKF